MAEEMKTPPTTTSTEGQPAAQAQQVQIPVDAAHLSSGYTNWYRVTGTPEELILDFGLTTQLGQMPTEPVRLNQRLVMNFYTAKRLLSALHWAVQRHESIFGVLEVDLQKRVRTTPGMPR